MKSKLVLMYCRVKSDLYECESLSTLLISSWYVLCFIWFVYACPFLALSPFVSSVNSLWCCGGLVCSSVALQLAILIGFLFYSEVVKKTHRPSQAALDILIGKQQRKVFTLQIHEGWYKIKLCSVSLFLSLALWLGGVTKNGRAVLQTGTVLSTAALAEWNQIRGPKRSCARRKPGHMTATGSQSFCPSAELWLT